MTAYTARAQAPKHGGRDPGYAEPQPRDPGDARRHPPAKPPNPDDGGMERDPDPSSADD